MADTSFIIWVQQYASPLLDSFFKAVTAIGSAEYYILIIPLLFWLYDKKFALRLGGFFLGNAWLNSFFKYIFQFSRPPLTLHKVVQGGFSFPSGHAQGSAGFWGYLAVQLRRPWGYTVAAALCALVSFSRIYLGVHYPRDIVFGILLALGWLFIYEVIAHKVQRQLSPWQWYLGSLFLSTFLLFLHPVGDGPMLAGFLLSSLLGYRLEGDRVKFRVKGLPWHTFFKVVIGLAVLLGLHSGLKPIFLGLAGQPAPDTALYGVATFGRYFVMGGWVTLLAPFTFKKLGLYKKD